jgi:hypothetical protein
MRIIASSSTTRTDKWVEVPVADNLRPDAFGVLHATLAIPAIRYNKGNFAALFGFPKVNKSARGEPMDDENEKKNLAEKAADAVSNAAQAVAEGVKSAGQAVADTAGDAAKVMAENITPKPIEAGDQVIIPSTDPSMPPVIVPARRKRKKAVARKAAPAPARKAAKGKREAPRKAGKKKAAKAKAAKKSRKATSAKKSKKAAGKTRKAARSNKAKTRRR